MGSIKFILSYPILRHSSPYGSMDSTADRQRPILVESFALELKIERRLVAAAHALDKRDRKTVSAFEVGTPRYSNFKLLPPVRSWSNCKVSSYYNVYIYIMMPKSCFIISKYSILA